MPLTWMTLEQPESLGQRGDRFSVSKDPAYGMFVEAQTASDMARAHRSARLVLRPWLPMRTEPSAGYFLDRGTGPD